MSFLWAVFKGIFSVTVLVFDAYAEAFLAEAAKLPVVTCAKRLSAGEYVYSLHGVRFALRIFAKQHVYLAVKVKLTSFYVTEIGCPKAFYLLRGLPRE